MTMAGLLLLRGMVEKLGKSRTGFNNHHIHGVKRTMQPGFSGAVNPVINNNNNNNNNYQHLLSCHYSSLSPEELDNLRNSLKYLRDREDEFTSTHQGSMNDPAVKELHRQEIEKDIKEMLRRHNEFRALKPTMVSSSSQPEIEGITPPSSQVGLQAKKGRFQWTDDMDQVLVDSLLEIVLAGPRRGENGFTPEELSKVVDKVHKCCHVVVLVQNVRARLKTLKKDCTNITELLKSASGFGLDSTGRVMADPLVWEAYLKEKLDARNLKGKLYRRYYDLVTIFGNESATGDRAITDNDFPHVSEDDINNSVDADLGDKNAAEEAQPSHLNTSKRAAQGGGLKAQRRLGHAMDDDALALVRIAQSFEKIAIAFEKQATQSHVNGQAILEKLRAMGIEEGDTIELMQLFEQDEKSGRFFLSINDDAFMRAWVYRKLRQDPTS